VGAILVNVWFRISSAFWCDEEEERTGQMCIPFLCCNLDDLQIENVTLSLLFVRERTTAAQERDDTGIRFDQPVIRFLFVSTEFTNRVFTSSSSSI
jgi:hypothetical protein